MNMLEALALARDEGKKVRPVSWHDGCFIIWHDESFSDAEWMPIWIGHAQGDLCPKEIFGEWEVVE